MRFTATPLKSQTTRGSRTDPGAALNLESLPSLPAALGEMIDLAAICRCMSSVVARLRHADGHEECLLFGVDRKSSTQVQTDVIDPKPTLSSRIDGHARDEGFSPAGAGPLRRAASSAAIARLS